MERIEAELREIKTILMMLVPSYGEIERKSAALFGWTDPPEGAMLSKSGAGNAKRR